MSTPYQQSVISACVRASYDISYWTINSCGVGKMRQRKHIALLAFICLILASRVSYAQSNLVSLSLDDTFFGEGLTFRAEEPEPLGSGPDDQHVLAEGDHLDAPRVR